MAGHFGNNGGYSCYLHEKGPYTSDRTGKASDYIVIAELPVISVNEGKETDLVPITYKPVIAVNFSK